MALSLYDAVGGYPWATWTSLREAWEVAEHYRMTYSKNLKVYAALQIDTEASDTARGHLALGGKTAYLLNINNGKPGDLPTLLWGNFGWSTWCHQIDTAIEVAIATNSRGPVTYTAGKKTFYHMADHGAWNPAQQAALHNEDGLHHNRRTNQKG